MSKKNDFIKLTYPPGYGLEQGFDTPPDPQVVPADLYDKATLKIFKGRGVTIRKCDKDGVSADKTTDDEAEAKAKAEAEAKAKADAEAKAKASR